MNTAWIIGLILFYFYTVTCTFFTVQIAALKGRRRAWGWLGLLLGIIGFAVVCFLPNAKGVTGETNPIKAAFYKITGIPPRAAWIFIIGIVVIVGGALLGTRVVTYIENRNHEKELTSSATEEELLTPSKVTGKVAGIFCGSGSNFAVTQSGDLYGWGKVGLNALDESGKVYTGVKKVSAAGDTLYLLMADGTLYAKGNNANALIPGQAAAYVDSCVKVEEDVKDISLTETAGALIKNSGNLYVFGVNTYGQMGRDADRVTDTNNKMAENVVKVVLTGRSLYYLTADGTVWGVGNNAYGQFGLGHKDPQGTPVQLAGDCADLAAGEDFLMLLKKDGTVWSAGNNCYGQLGREVGEPVAPAEGEAPTVALAKAEHFGQLPQLAGVTAIRAGGHSAFALVGAELYGWGHNHMGQLGKGRKNLQSPTLITKEAAEVAVGYDCTLLLNSEGALLGAGNGYHYKLGARHANEGFSEIAQVKGA